MATKHNISGGKHKVSGSPIKALQTSVGNLSAQQGSVDMKSLLSLLDARYLRKIIEDTSYNNIYFKNSSVNAKDFKTIGARAGNVTGVGALITTNADGTAKMEIDELAVRRIMYVNELIIAQATHTGGVNLTSAANAVIADFTFVNYDDDSCPTDILDLINYSLEDDEKLDGVWRCRFDNQNNNLTNLYQVGDVALAQTFNYDPSGNYEMKYYRRRVLGIGMNYIDLELGGIALAGVEGSNIANGDNACQWGHLWDRKRQSVVEINTLEGGRQSFFQKMGDCRDVLAEERREVDYEDMTLDEKRAIWGSDLWYNDTDKNVLDMGYLYTNVFGDAEWRNAIIIKGDFAAITKDGKQGFKVNNKTGEVEVACKKFSVLSEFKTYDESWFVGTDTDLIDIKDADLPVEIFKASEVEPPKPTELTIPPTGWVLDPPITTMTLWSCRSTKKPIGNTVEAWGNVVQWTGKDGEDAISTATYSTNGNIFNNGNIDTVLSAHVFKGGTEVTDQILASSFTWTRVSDDTAGDEAWNELRGKGKKSITITVADVVKKAVFNWEVDSDVEL